MKEISDIIKDYKIAEAKAKNFNSERAELIQKFIDRIDEERVGTDYGPVQPKAVALKINQNPRLKEMSDLYAFYQKCEKAKSFGACFFYFTKLSTAEHKKI